MGEAAGALAGARTHGGEDYNGYHAFMALAPSLEMSARLHGRERPLPVLKVLHRNTRFIQDAGGRRHEKLRQVEPAASANANDVRAFESVSAEWSNNALLLGDGEAEQVSVGWVTGGALKPPVPPPAQCPGRRRCTW